MKTLKEHLLSVNRDEVFTFLLTVTNSEFHPTLVDGLTKYLDEVASIELQESQYTICIDYNNLNNVPRAVSVIDNNTSGIKHCTSIFREELLSALCADVLPINIVARILFETCTLGWTSDLVRANLFKIRDISNLILKGDINLDDVSLKIIDPSHELTTEEITESAKKLTDAYEKLKFEQALFDEEAEKKAFEASLNSSLNI